MTDIDNLPALPTGWCWTTIGEISEIIHYGFTASSEEERVGPKMLRITDIQNNHVNWNSVPYCKIDYEQKEKYLLKAGDLVFARTGATVGKSYLIKGEIPESVFASYLIRLILSSKINNEYVYNFFQSANYWLQIRKGQVGIGQPNVNSKVLSQIEIPLPPLLEQHRIVQKIEELFTDLDAGVKELEKAKVQIKIYRQAVLKLALKGKLFQQDPEDEPALKLIETIRADLTKDKIDGKKLVSIDSEENLFELPDSWKWIRLGEVLTFGPKNGYSPKPVKHVTNVRALTLTATTSGKFRDDCFKYIDEEIDANSHLWLEENDLLIQRGNTIEYVGVAAVYKGASNAFIYPDLMMKMRVHPKINVDFLHIVINSKFSRKYFEKRATGTAGSMPKVNQSTIINIPIPLPPLAEQNRIVSEIERRFSVIDQIEKIIDQSLIQAEKLRQSILKKAFKGKLVSQDPNDEPAFVLLERIKQEKGRAESRKKPEKKTKVKAETIMEISGKTKQAELF